MPTKNINYHELLKKYFDARTSPAEEKILRNAFLKDKVPKELQTYKAIFVYEASIVSKQKNVTFSKTCLLKKAKNLFKQVTSRFNIPILTTPVVQGNTFSVLNNQVMVATSGLVACIITVLFVVVFSTSPTPPHSLQLINACTIVDNSCKKAKSSMTMASKVLAQHPLNLPSQ